MPSTAYSDLSGIPKPAYITLHHFSILTILTTAGVCCDSRLSVRSATDAFLLLSLQTLTLFLRSPVYC